MKVLMALPLLLVALSGCTSEPTFVTPPQDDAGNYIVEMTGALTYSPRQFEVPAGATVAFRNTGTVWHDVESTSGAWATSNQIDAGETWFLTVPDEPGEYNFFCNPHKANGMTGVMRVV